MGILRSTWKMTKQYILNVLVFLNFSTFFWVDLKTFTSMENYNLLISDKSQMKGYIFYFNFLYWRTSQESWKQNYKSSNPWQFSLRIIRKSVKCFTRVSFGRPIQMNHEWLVSLFGVKNQFPEFHLNPWSGDVALSWLIAFEKRMHSWNKKMND